MSRIAKNPIELPASTDVVISKTDIGQEVQIKGSRGELIYQVHPAVQVEKDNDFLKIIFSNEHKALAGTTRANLANIVCGVTKGFEKKLKLIGVGYRAQLKGKVLNLTLGFSHPVNYQIPEGIAIETPSQTEVVVKGINKQLVGQVSAEIRAFRPPEPYKGKGVRYEDEAVVRKEAKKK